MPGLSDIIPITRVIHGATFRGVSNRDIAALFDQFPVLGKLATGGKGLGSEILQVARDAIPMIIAAGVGEMDNSKTVDEAGNLPIEQQIDIVEGVIQLTFPKGIPSFVERLQRAQASVLGPGAPGKAPDITSEQASPTSPVEDTDTTTS